MDIGLELAALRKKLEAVERQARLGHAAIDNTAVVVKDSAGSLRGIIGLQADGTTAVNIVNAPPPPQPSAPIVASVLGGVTVSWDGAFADGSTLPLDWARVEVHASPLAVYTPDATTLKTTIETAQGATVVVSCTAPVYIRLVARNTSGTASLPSDPAGPFGPTPVVASDVLDGIVTTVKLADDAVTQAKVATGAIGTTEISDNAVTTPKLIAGAVQTSQLAADAVAAGKIAANAVTAREIAALSVTADQLAANAVTAGKIAAGAVTATSLTVGIAQSIAEKLNDAMGDSSMWAQVSGTGTPTWLTGVTDASAGSTVLQSNGYCTMERQVNIPYDPDALYKVTVRLRVTTAPTIAVNISLGLSGIAADGTSRVNTAGTNTTSLQHFVAASGISIATGTGWSTYTGYIKGTAASGTGTACPDPKAPGAAHSSVRYVRPLLRLLLNATDGVAQVDQVTVETVPTGVVNNVNIADGAITASKILAGSVDATALAADAITGKTITGGTITGTTITGGTMQTAASGERITLNEAGFNKVLVYNSAGTAIGELSSQGLLVKGSNGAVLWLNPNATYPQLKLNNANGSNSAIIQLDDGSSGDANLITVGGRFTSDTFTDMCWRTWLGTDGYAVERVRFSNTSTVIGSRISMTSTLAQIGYWNTTDTTQNTQLQVQAGLSSLSGGRLQVLPPASVNSALYVNAATGHTGNLLRLSVNAVDKATVDKDGNTTIQGTLTAGNTTTGRVSVTPAATSASALLVNAATGHTGNLLRLQLNSVDFFKVDAGGSTTISGDLTVAGIGQRTTKRRTSDATKTSNTTPANDSQITFSVDANAVYVVDGLLMYSGPGDIIVGWATPTGAAGTWQGMGNGISVVSGTNTNGTQQDAVSTWGYTVRTESTDIGSTRNYGGITSTAFGIQIRGLLRVGSTAGTFALQWAQGTSNATATTLYTDSHIRLEKVA
ncbi:hypothetical protein ABZX39_33425 [Streptomyces collinus]|uniref:hypothetical protein n=1 Tax=Streptomyces collinus TaxID=42684 RepID=UPI00339F7C28